MEATLVTKEEARQIFARIMHLAGSTRAPGYGERKRKVEFDVYKEHPLHDLVSIEDFRKIAYGHNRGMHVHTSKNGKNKAPRPHIVNNIVNEQGSKIVIIEAVRKTIPLCPRFPTDMFMTALFKSLGYSHSAWYSIKEQLTYEGYAFNIVPGGYEIELPNPKRKRMNELEKELQRLSKELDELKRENDCEQSGLHKSVSHV